MRTFSIAVLVAAFAVSASALGIAKEPIVIGAAIAQTGPAASLGVGEVNAANMFVKAINANGGIAGHPLKLVTLDTASSFQKAVLDVRKLIIKDNVVGVICCTLSGGNMAIMDTVQRYKVPTIALAPSVDITEPVAKRHWVFKIPPNDAIMIRADIKDMQQRGITTLGVMNDTETYGQLGYKAWKKLAASSGIKILGHEQFALTATNVSGQAAKMAGANPQAVVIWAIPPSANVAEKALQDAGFKGTIYQSYGVTNPAFLRLGGASLNGTRLSVLPVVVWDQLPGALPFKPVVGKFVKAYKAAYGEAPSSFAGHPYDALLLFSAAASKVIASGKARPSDTAGFRAALRGALETLGDVQGVDGTFNITNADHNGLGPSSAVMVTIENGGWKAIK